jgi:ABC-2 type transport system ATP-binding protein
MRLELIAALLHKPRILFLDEPTIGLDLIGRAKMRDFIYDYNRKSEATILLTSHNMDDLANLARRVIVINDGWIIFDGMFEEFLGIYAKEKLIKVNLSQETDLGELRKIGKINKIAYPEVLISVPRSTTAVAAAEILQNYPVDGLTIEEIPIEEAVRHLLAYAKIN